MDTAGQTDAPPGLSNIVAIAAGGNHSLALTGGGEVVAWGLNTSGQATVPGGLTNIVAIAAGTNHSVALRGDGRVITWGDNSLGQCAVPPTLSNVVAIAAGASFNLALLSSGRVTGWGDNSQGQIPVPSGFVDTVAIAAGAFHSLLLLGSGEILGLGAGKLSVSTFPDLGQAMVPPYLDDVVAMAAGAAHSLVLAGEGAPYITETPVGRWATAGDQVFFRAAATGASPLSYQWQFNGAPVSGATNALWVITNAGYAGVCQVVVSNLLGVVTSGVATLSLSPRAPFFLTQPATQTLFPGASLSLWAAAAGSEPISYQWLFDGVSLGGQTNATLWLGDMQLTQAGPYSVVASNASGTYSSAKANINVTQIAAWGGGSAGQTNIPLALAGVLRVAVGSYHCLALKADGTVVAWGAEGRPNQYKFRPNGSACWPDGSGGNRRGRLPQPRAYSGRHRTGLGRRRREFTDEPYAYGQSIVPTGLSDVVAIAAGEYTVSRSRAMDRWSSGADKSRRRRALPMSRKPL